MTNFSYSVCETFVTDETHERIERDGPMWLKEPNTGQIYYILPSGKRGWMHGVAKEEDAIAMGIVKG